MAICNYKSELRTIFIYNPKIKACLHKAKRIKKPQEIKQRTISLKEVNELYIKYKTKGDLNALACFLTVLTCARINNIISAEFRISECPDDNNYFILRFCGTKTTAHSILVHVKFKPAFKNYLELAERVTYSNILVYCKRTFACTTHCLRRSGATILENSNLFQKEDIKIYGNWSVGKDTLSSSYLRNNSYKKICSFWEMNIKI